MEIKNTVRVFCAKCKEEIDIVDTDFICSLPGGRALFVNAVCPNCEKEKKSSVMVRCSRCKKVSRYFLELDHLVSPGTRFLCEHCTEHVTVARYNSTEALWETEEKRVTPGGGSYIEVVDYKDSRGFDTRMATGERSEDTKQVLAWNLEGEYKYSCKYWRYVGEKDWRR